MYVFPMSRVITVTEARARLQEMVELVQSGEEVTLTRHGVPVAVMVNPASLRPRRAERAFEVAARLGELLGEARDRPFDLTDTVTTAWAAELVSAIRADRDR